MQTSPPGSFTAAAAPASAAPQAQPCSTATTRAAAIRPTISRSLWSPPTPLASISGEASTTRTRARGSYRPTTPAGAPPSRAAPARAGRRAGGRPPAATGCRSGSRTGRRGQRQRTVRRRRVQPARVDRLDDRAAEGGRAVRVRREVEVREHPLRGVGPAVAGEQRRRQHQRRGPDHGGVPDQLERARVRPRLRDPAAQSQPGRGEQPQADQDDHQREHPGASCPRSVRSTAPIPSQCRTWVLRGSVETTSPPSRTRTLPVQPRDSTSRG